MEGKKIENILEVEESINFTSERTTNILGAKKIKVQVSITKPETLSNTLNKAVLVEVEDCYRELFSVIRSELAKQEQN